MTETARQICPAGLCGPFPGDAGAESRFVVLWHCKVVTPLTCVSAQVQIEGDFLACSFSILEEQPMDMLLGLDMLKRHQVSKPLLK